MLAGRQADDDRVHSSRCSRSFFSSAGFAASLPMHVRWGAGVVPTQLWSLSSFWFHISTILHACAHMHTVCVWCWHTSVCVCQSAPYVCVLEHMTNVCVCVCVLPRGTGKRSSILHCGAQFDKLRQQRETGGGAVGCPYYYRGVGWRGVVGPGCLPVVCGRGGRWAFAAAGLPALQVWLAAGGCEEPL